MRAPLLLACTAALALAVGRPAAAGDTDNAYGAGGLVMERAPGLRLRAQEMFVSEQEVRIDYRFFNATGRDIEAAMAFPIPDLVGGAENSDLFVPDDIDRILNFAITIDGEPVRNQVEHAAFARGRDVTSLLRERNIPLNPWSDATGVALNLLPNDTQQELMRDGLIAVEAVEVEARPRVYLYARWTLKTRNAWTQAFPAGREVTISLLYRPAVGGSYSSPFDPRDPPAPARLAEHQDRRCPTPALAEAARRASQQQFLTETWIDVLSDPSPGWDGPIEDYRLVVDAGREGNLVSFCGDDAAGRESHRVEIRRRNFTPDRDLSVLILKPHDFD